MAAFVQIVNARISQTPEVIAVIVNFEAANNRGWSEFEITAAPDPLRSNLWYDREVKV